MSEHVLMLKGAEMSGVNRANSPQRAARAPSARACWRRPESWEYRLLYSVTFVVFLVAAMIETLSPRRIMARAKAPQEIAGNEHQTIIQKASLGARTCVAYAFMG